MLLKFILVILVIIQCESFSLSPKIAPNLRAKLLNGRYKTTNVKVNMKRGIQSTLDDVTSKSYSSKTEKRTAIMNALKANALESQQGLLDFLEEQQFLSFQSMWLTNQIFVRNVTVAVVQMIAEYPSVDDVQEQVKIIIDPIVDDPNAPPPKGNGTAEWGVEKIHAPECWNNSNANGSGIVVSNIDTGVLVSHEALAANYRVNYGWFDPYKGSETPNDQHGHGTHTMGTIAGGKGVGVAPGSTWIACKGCASGRCEEEGLVKCGQWIACPTTPNDTNPDCSKTPDVCSNSWGGGSDSDFYNNVITAWRAMDIIPVFALGNSGPACATASSPGDQPNLISVGATNIKDKVARFSSRGPALNGKEKPEVSAPGEKIKSAYYKSDDSYAVLSGTSMACPHTAGAVAVMLSASPTLKYDDLFKALTLSAIQPQLHPAADKSCGDDSTKPWPNNGFGYGRIDVEASLGRLALDFPAPTTTTESTTQAADQETTTTAPQQEETTQQQETTQPQEETTASQQNEETTQAPSNENPTESETTTQSSA